MKKGTRAVMALAMIYMLASCHKNLGSNSSALTPLQNFIGTDSSLTMYNALVIKANDGQLFTGSDSVTILAPTNAAFIASGITPQSINSWPATTADSLVRYHYIAGPADLVTGSYTSLKSLLGPAVFGNTDGTGSVFYFNGAGATLESLTGGAATLYELNTVLQLPATSFSQLLAADTTLSFFAEALKRTGLNATLGANGWNTVFAPVNSAFISNGFTNVDSVDLNTLTTIIQYHILNGQYFTSDLDNMVSIGNLEGGYINITYGAGVLQLTGTGNLGPATVTSANKLAGSNIIVDKINGVLLP